MKKEISTIKKSCKQAKVLLLIIFVMMFIAFMTSGINLIKGMMHDEGSYRLEEKLDHFKDKEYHLMIAEKDFGPIDIVEYSQTSTENGETNYKACFIIEGVNYLMKLSMVIAIILLVGLAMNDIEKDGRPFNQRNIKRLRIISVLVMTFAVIPGMIQLLLHFLLFLKASATIDTTDILILMIGFAICAIATVFEYGNAVQEEMDSIA